jgi:DNA-directed RNA polymerase
MALQDGQPPITAIHDAYGTVAGAMWQLFSAVRTAFIWVHSDDVLNDFRRVCVSMLRDHLMATVEGIHLSEAELRAEEIIKRLPTRGTLDINTVADSDYFFA